MLVTKIGIDIWRPLWNNLYLKENATVLFQKTCIIKIRQIFGKWLFSSILHLILTYSLSLMNTRFTINFIDSMPLEKVNIHTRVPLVWLTIDIKTEKNVHELLKRQVLFGTAKEMEQREISIVLLVYNYEENENLKPAECLTLQNKLLSSGQEEKYVLNTIIFL